MIVDFTKLSIKVRSLKKLVFALVKLIREWVSGTKETSIPAQNVLGETTERRVVPWPAFSIEAASHVLILGASGSAKTTLAANALAREYLAGQISPRDKQPALVVIDPKGDHSEAIMQFCASEAPEYLQRIRWVDPFAAGGGVALNFCRLAEARDEPDILAESIAHLIADTSRVTGDDRALSMGPNQISTLSLLLLAAIASDHPARCPLWAYDALVEKHGIERLAELTSSDRARQGLKGLKLNDDRIASLSARLRALAITDDLERVVSAPSCLDPGALLAPGQITLATFAAPPGGSLHLQKMYASLVALPILKYLLRRTTPFTGHPVRLVVEETHLLASVLGDISEVLLTTGRARAVGLTAITQGTTLLEEASPTLLRVLIENSPTKICGRLSAEDAALFARSQSPSLGIEEKIRDVQETFAASVTNLPDRTFFLLAPGRRERFKTTSIDFAKRREAASKRQHEIEAVKQRYVLPPATRARITLSDATGARMFVPVSAISPWGES